MYENLETFVETLVKTKLTPNQFFFLQLLFEKKWAMVYKYCAEGKGFTEDDVRYLEEHEYIVSLNNTEEFYHDQYYLTDKFTNVFLTDDDYSKKLWNEYPSFININMRKAPSKGCGFEEFEKIK